MLDVEVGLQGCGIRLAAVQHIPAAAADQDVIAGKALERVGAVVAFDRVVEVIAGPGERVGSRCHQFLDERTQGKARRTGVNDIDAGIDLRRDAQEGSG